MRAARERCGEGNEGQVVGVGTARCMHGVVVMTPRRTPQCMGVGFTGFDLPCSLLFFWWLSTCAVLAFSFYPTGLHTVYRHACVSCPLPRSYTLLSLWSKQALQSDAVPAPAPEREHAAVRRRERQQCLRGGQNKYDCIAARVSRSSTKSHLELATAEPRRVVGKRVRGWMMK